MLFFCGAMLAAHAASAVTCAPAAGAAAPGWTVLHVKRSDLKPGSVLLGLDGGRVTVPSTLFPEPGGAPWHARVDWEKHKVAPGHSPAAALLYLDAAQQGKRALCRIDVRDFTEEYIQRNLTAKPPTVPGPADLAVFERSELRYDGGARLVSVIEHARDDSSKALQRKQTACFHYNAMDRYLGASLPDADGCAGSGPEQIQDRYVYQADGALLRKVSAEKRMPGLDGKPFVTDAAQVTVFDGKGQPSAEYVEDDAKRHYRRSLGGKRDDGKYRAVKVVGSAAALDLRRLVDSKTPGFWQFYSMPSTVANNGNNDNDQRYLVASGDQPAIGKSERDAVWKALARPDHDMVLEAQGMFLLVPEVSAPLWKACMSPQVDTRAACP
jgi:hypothetical protein